MHCTVCGAVPHSSNQSSRPSCDITFFMFPKDTSLRAKWLKALQMKNLDLNERSVVCSNHFLKKDLLVSSSGVSSLRDGGVPVVDRLMNSSNDCSMGKCELKVCRICFATDCKLYSMTEKQDLNNAYKNLTGLLIEDEHNLPLYVCTECSHQLLNCARFRSRSLRAHLIMIDIVKKQDCITLDSIKSAVEKQTLLGYEGHSQSDHYDVDMTVLEESLDDNGQVDLTQDGIENELNEVIHDDNLSVVDISSLRDDIKVEVMKAEDEDEEVDVGSEARFMFSVQVDIKEENPELNEDGSNRNVFGDEARSSGVVSMGDMNNKAVPNVKGVEQAVNIVDVYPKSDTQHETDCDLIIDEKLSCNVCLYRAVNEAQLLSHLKTHGVTKLYKCNYSSIENIQSHSRENYGKVLYSCDVCNRVFNTQCELQTHLKTHSKKKTYTCDICKKNFTLKSNLQCHLRLHSGERPYSCQFCTKTFTRSDHLKSHLRVHSIEKPFRCDVCKMKFTTKVILKQHLELHLGDKPFKCGICKKSFVRKCNLVTHLRTHIGEKPLRTYGRKRSV